MVKGVIVIIDLTTAIAIAIITRVRAIAANAKLSHRHGFNNEILLLFLHKSPGQNDEQ